MPPRPMFAKTRYLPAQIDPDALAMLSRARLGGLPSSGPGIRAN